MSGRIIYNVMIQACDMIEPQLFGTTPNYADALDSLNLLYEDYPEGDVNIWIDKIDTLITN